MRFHAPARALGLAIALTLTPTVLRTAAAQQAPAPGADVSPADWDSVTLDWVKDDNAGVEIAKLLELSGQRLKARVVVDPQLAGQKIRLAVGDVPMTWGTFKQVLEFYDVVTEVRVEDGHRTVFAHLRRNFATRSALPYAVIGVDETARHPGEVVTAVLQVKNGCGPDIFATVRGLLVRDVNRISNIIYVRGPEAIIINDFAANVDYYTQIIRKLDVPALSAQARVFHLAHENAVEAAAALDKLFASAAAHPSKDGGAAPVPTIAANARGNDLLVEAFPTQMTQIESFVRDLNAESTSSTPAAAATTPTTTPATPTATTAVKTTSVGAGAAVASSTSFWWPFGAVCASLAFLGQTLILRRTQARLARLKG